MELLLKITLHCYCLSYSIQKTPETKHYVKTTTVLTVQTVPGTDATPEPDNFSR